jgi:hypothetical protein
MKRAPCEICGKRDATTTLLMVIGRNCRAVRTCEPRCAAFVEDVAISIPPLVDTILLYDSQISQSGRLPTVPVDLDTELIASATYLPPPANMTKTETGRQVATSAC